MGNRTSLLRKMDCDNKNGRLDMKDVDKIFYKWDNDHSGCLTGAECNSVVDELTDIVMSHKEYKDKSYLRDQVKYTIHKKLDANKDGVYSRDELLDSIRSILNMGIIKN